MDAGKHWACVLRASSGAVTRSVRHRLHAPLLLKCANGEGRLLNASGHYPPFMQAHASAMVCRGDGIYKRKELSRVQAADHGLRGVLLNECDHLSRSEPSG